MIRYGRGQICRLGGGVRDKVVLRERQDTLLLNW